MATSDPETIRDGLLEQFNRSFKMLYAVFDNIPTDKWASGITSAFVPAAIAYHTIESLDFYFCGKPGDEFRWGYRFRGPWWETAKEDLPTKKEIIAYLQEVEGRIKEFLTEKTDNELLEAFKLYDGSGKTLLGHLVYALRHTMHHQGQLTALQLHFGVEGDSWS